MPGLMPAVPVDLLDAAEEVSFPRAQLSGLKVGDMCYAVWDVADSDASAEARPWGFLSKVTAITDTEVQFQLADAHKATKVAQVEGDHSSSINTEEGKDVFLVTPAHPVAEVQPRPPSAEDADIDATLENCNTWTRSVVDADRRGVLRATIRKLHGKDPTTLSDDDIVAVVKEALSVAKDALEHAAPAVDPPPPIAMGQNKANVAVVRYALAAFASARSSEQLDVAALMAHLDGKFADVLKAVQVSGASAPVTPAEKAPTTVGGMKSMSTKTGGMCAYEAAGVIRAVSEGKPLAELDSSTMVQSGKMSVTTNVIAISKECTEFQVYSTEPTTDERAKQAVKIWKEVTAMKPQEILDEVVAGKEWGGFVTLAASAWDLTTETVVLHADSIHAKASDTSVEAGIHPAMLAGLPSGAAKKTRAFVILKKSHYYAGYTSTGGSIRTVFNIGADADQAQALIVAHLKSANKGPLEELDQADQLEAITKTIGEWHAPKPEVTYANKVKGGVVVQLHPAKPKPAPGRSRQRSSGQSTPRARSRSRSVPRRQSHSRPRRSGAERNVCWSYRDTGKCSFKGKCKFEHVPKKAGKGSEPSWQVAGRKKSDKRGCPVMKVHSKADVQCGRWRSLLKQVDAEAAALSSWVTREGDWYVLHAKPTDAAALLDRLTPLRKLQWTVEPMAEVVAGDPGDDEPGNCSDFLVGKTCTHSPPCK